MGNKKNTTRILVHNINTNELFITANKKILADYFNTNWHNIVEWFREGKIIRKEYNGDSYILYKPDYSLNKYSPL